MDYKITQDQYDKLKFRRRLEEFQDFIKESPVYKLPCQHADNSEEFIFELIKDVTNELHDTDVPVDFINMVIGFIRNYMGDTLIEYYNSKCDKKINEMMDISGEPVQSNEMINIKGKVIDLDNLSDDDKKSLQLKEKVIVDKIDKEYPIVLVQMTNGKVIMFDVDGSIQEPEENI